MHQKKYSECAKCDECINNTSNPLCNVACMDKSKNCYENYKSFSPKTYARANIVLQPYQRLFDLNDGFKAGTIFKDLYSPYCEIKYVEDCKDE